MTGETTSLPALDTTRQEWASFRTFLKRPSLPDQGMAPMAAGLAAIPRMLALDIALMSALLAIAGIVMLIGVDLPATALAGVEIGWSLAFMVVVVAPFMEELAFRGWLSGKPGHVVALVLILGAGIAGAMLVESTTGFEQAGTALTGLAITFLIALVALFLLRKHPPMGWFRAIFPALFWLSTLAFASIHLLNFQEAGAALLPLVLPQFILGAILGYMRVHYGLWTCIALHSVHNGLIIAIVLLAS